MLEIKEDSDNKKVFLQIDNLSEMTRRGIRQGFFRLGKDLRARLKKDTLKKNKSGRVYIRRTRAGARKRHRASAPGETPASRTGNYWRNIGYKIKGAEELEFGIREGAPYGVFLEKGTRNMAPRPGLGNTVKALERNANEYFETSVERELKNEG